MLVCIENLSVKKSHQFCCGTVPRTLALSTAPGKNAEKGGSKRRWALLGKGRRLANQAQTKTHIIITTPSAYGTQILARE
jgi:hypothetical protein